MWRYIVKRIIQAGFALFAISFIVFILTHLSGDPALLIASPWASLEDIEKIRVQLGLDQPIYIQYWRFISGAIQGNLGESIKFGRPNVELWLDLFPNTLLVAGLAFIFATGAGILVGTISAIKPGSWFDNLGKVFAFMGVSLPSFWVGLMLMLLFSVGLGWLPVMGMESWRHLILPTFTLGWFAIAGQLRLTRSAMLDVLDSEYIKMARIKGVPEYLVIGKHALRNALIPIVTVGALNFVGLLTGTVIVETIFNWRGVGWLAVQAIYARDYPLVQTCVMLGSSLLIFMNLLVDILYAYIDPRIRYR